MCLGASRQGCPGAGSGSDEELWKDVANFAGMAQVVLYKHLANLRRTLEDKARTKSRTDARAAASHHSAVQVSAPLLVSDILSLLARFLPEFQAARLAVELAATIGQVNQKMSEIFFTSLLDIYAELYQAVLLLTAPMPDWRRQPAVLRAGLRVAIAGALAHSTMVSLLPYMEDTPAMVQRLPEMEAKVSFMSTHVTYLWSLVLAQDGVKAPPTGQFRMDGDVINRMTTDRVAVLPSPSSPQLVPLALDLVLGMENMLQVRVQVLDSWQQRWLGPVET
ncbi:hypothetical protein V8C86DRAFT_1684972 [Haematococcus lacustris]